MRKVVLCLLALSLFVSIGAIARAQGQSPAQYCKQATAEVPQFFNACVVCAAHGSPGPESDIPICTCKAILAGFFGPSPYHSIGECLQDIK